MARLIIVDATDADAGYRVASTLAGVTTVVTPDQLRTATHRSEPRDVAVRFFSPMADALVAPDHPVLVLPRLWPASLPAPLQRMLQRTALSLGGVLATPPPSPARPAPAAALLRPLPSPQQAPSPAQTTPQQATTPAHPAPARSLDPFYRLNGAVWGGPRGALPGGVPALLALGWANRGPGAGAYRPGAVTLLVGERPNVARTGELKHRIPLVTFAGTGCAIWLAQQLEDAGVPESILYWINAYDAVGVPTDAAFLDDLQPHRVIAMGKLAERWCTDHASKFETVPHPQYWKRFHGNQRYPLLDQLREFQP
jgi:hypothetical protein